MTIVYCTPYLMVSPWLVSPLLAKDWARRSSKPLPRNCCTYLDTRGRGSHYVLPY